MLTVMTGAWGNEPTKYESIDDYLQKADPKIFVNFTNSFLAMEYPKAPKFVMGAEERKLISDYVEKHKEKAYPIAENTYDYFRLNNLIDAAINDIMYKRGWYNFK